MIRSTTLALVLLFVASTAFASPLGVRINDQDFTFDTDFIANYNFNGTAADTLTVGDTNNSVGSYRFLGQTTDFAGNGTGFFPVWGASTPSAIFGGSLDLSMAFNQTDATANGSANKFAVSLTGGTGHLTVTGIVGVPPGFTPPNGSTLTTLLDITFARTSLVGRDAATTTDNSVIDLIEAAGTVNTLMGQDVSSQNLTGVTFLKFFAPAGTSVFKGNSGTGNAIYNPLTATVNGTPASILGRVSGEAGVGTFIPEPMTLSILALGIPMILRRHRR